MFDHHPLPDSLCGAATGFRTSLDELLGVADVLDERSFPAFPSGHPTAHPGFYIYGLH
jgi:hypothetical protein